MNSIVCTGSETRIITDDAGTYVMSTALFQRYQACWRPTEKTFASEFFDVLSRLNNNSNNFNARIASLNQELDAMALLFLAQRGEKAYNFLVQGKLSSYIDQDKSARLWPVTPDLLDLMTRNRILYLFSPGMESLTQFEHKAIGGGAPGMLNHPFMAGYSTDAAVIASNMNVRRCRLGNRGNKIAMSIYVSDNWSQYRFKEELSEVGVAREYGSHVFYRHSDSHNEIGKEWAVAFDAVRPALQSIFESSSKLLPAESFDYVRIVTKSVQFENDLIAVPEPLALEFFSEGKHIASSTNPDLLNIVRPRKNDVSYVRAKLPGQEAFITFQTIQNTHYLSEAPGGQHWYVTYYNRLLSDLRKFH